MKKGFLHELLAIEGDLKGEREKVKEEAIVTFSKKANLFLGYAKKLNMFSEERSEEEGEDQQAVTETVPGKLKYAAGAFTRYWDIRLQKEAANQEAKSDVVVDGNIMFMDLPVSFLLGMEEELKQLRKVFDSIPTLTPGIVWEKDVSQGEDIHKAKHDIEKNKTEKLVQHKVVVPATKEHPAQVAQWNDDKPVGKYITTNWSGMVTPSEKSGMLGRLDKVLRAFKQARQRANTQETKSLTVGKEIFNFICK